MSVNPEFSNLNNGQAKIFEKVNTDVVPKIGVLALAPLKKYNAIVTRQFCNCAKEALRTTKPKKEYWRWHRKKNMIQVASSRDVLSFLHLHDRGIPSDSCRCYWRGTVIAIHMERTSRDVDKRPSLFGCAVALLLSTWKQNEQHSETVFELGKK